MLSECHAHIFMNGLNYPAARALYAGGITVKCREDIAGHLAAYKEAGITYVRDGGDPYGACIEAKRMAQEWGIEYRIPAFAIHRKGRYGGIVGRGFTSMREYQELVQEAGRLGADFIKVMLSGIMDFDTGGMKEEPLSAVEIQEMIHIAHEEGFAVMAHVNGDRAIRQALESGVDSIEHGNYMGEETVHLLADCDAVWVPTNVTIHNLKGCGRFPEAVVSQLDSRQIRNIQLAYRLGARVASGSDAGAYRVPHGKGLLAERERICMAAGGADAKIWLNEGDAWIRERFVRR